MDDAGLQSHKMFQLIVFKLFFVYWFTDLFCWPAPQNKWWVYYLDVCVKNGLVHTYVLQIVKLLGGCHPSKES